jgi:hypothetical protein
VAFLILVLALMLLPFALLGVGVMRALHVSRDAGALRNSVLRSGGAEWDKTIEIRTGPVLWGLARAGLAFVDMPAEARTALRAVHGAEVGVYRLREGARRPQYAAMLVETDQTMKARGWTRLVGVVDRDELVAAYLPEQELSARDLKICLVVLNRQDMVVVSARSDLEPLLELALRQAEVRRPGLPSFRL